MADNSTILVLGVDMEERLRWTWALREQQPRDSNNGLPTAGKREPRATKDKGVIILNLI